MVKSIRVLLATFALAFAAIALPAPAHAVETTIVYQQVDINGLDIVLSAANTDGSKFLNPSDERTFLVCANSNGATRTVTVETQIATATLPGFGSVPLSDQAAVVPLTSGLTIIGPFPPAQFNDSSGYVHVTYSAVSGLTCGVARLSRPQ